MTLLSLSRLYHRSISTSVRLFRYQSINKQRRFYHNQFQTDDENQDYNRQLISKLSPQHILRLAARLSPLALEAEAVITTNSHNQHKQKEKIRTLSPIVRSITRISSIHCELNEISLIITDAESDNDLRILAKDELVLLNSQLFDQSINLLYCLFDHYQENDHDHDHNDISQSQNSVLVEIRAGTGGDEASLFACELIEMYINLSNILNYKSSVISKSQTSLKGIRQAILKISSSSSSASSILKMLQTESGVHRVQRVPKTETQGRVHTSTATVSVLPDYTSSMKSKYKLESQDLKFDVYRASGAGGQHVNTTESAVRVTHLPTGTVSTCQDERSQHRNRAVALEQLTVKIVSKMAADNAKLRLEEKRKQLGSGCSTGGERSDRVRTYNFQQRRVTDHRILIDDSIKHIINNEVQLLHMDKNYGLEGVLIGGKELLRLMNNVRNAWTLKKICYMIKLADEKRRNDDDEFQKWNDIFLNEKSFY